MLPKIGILRTFFLVLIFSIIKCTISFSQITPAGLGRTNTAFWTVVSVRQDLDTARKWQSVTYIGYSSVSGQDDYDPFKNKGILVLNQEFYQQVHKNIQLSYALSYRNQYEYEEEAPYDPRDPEFFREFRLYTRITAMHTTPRARLAFTTRFDFRTFTTPDWQTHRETFQFRTRFRGQLTINFTKDKVHRGIFAAEALISTRYSEIPQKRWSPYAYKDARMAATYSFSPPNHPIMYNTGFMFNVIDTGVNTFVATFFNVDIVIKNLFKKM